HDRVQNAAYELLSPHERNRIHLRIARVLLQDETRDDQRWVPSEGPHTAPRRAALGQAQLRSRVDERLFDIVGHLDQSWELIDDPAERRRGLLLNLQAGRRAKLNAGYDVALRCLRHAMGNLP